VKRHWPTSRVLQAFFEQLEVCRKHDNEAKWLAKVRYIDTKTLKPHQLLVFTDFAASLNLVAGETANCATARHAVCDNFVALHSRRDVVVNVKNKTFVHSVCECDIWHFFGDSMSKGKKNDHVIHAACLDDVVRTYQETSNVAITEVIVWTDNCGGQYKCNQNFYKIATAADRLQGVEVKHRFAQKYCFKGVWDGAGMVVKHKIRSDEIACTGRYPDAITCYKELKVNIAEPKNKKDWDKWEQEKDPKILDKTDFVTSKRYFGFATEDKVEFKRLEKEGYSHIVFTDRVNIPTMDVIKGTQMLHSIAGDPSSKEVSTDGQHDSYSLIVGQMPCACQVCRGEITDQKCPYEHIRKERRIRVSEKVPRQQKEGGNVRQPPNPANEAMYDELGIKLRVDKVTVKELQAQLRERNLPFSGSKSTLAARLTLFFKRFDEHPGERPLATDYIRIDEEEDDSNKGDDLEDAVSNEE